MYGTEDHHASIRKTCMEYIRRERGFFESYIHGDFEEYLARKSTDGVWGDDIELEAMSEIYNRPIEIYAYSSEPMRTFHETNFKKSEPIRLSYHGMCHYNSVRNKKNPLTTGYLHPESYGEIEGSALKRSVGHLH